MGFEFAHFNFNVTSLENSKKFYEEALGLKEIHRMTGNGFTLVYLGDGRTPFELELTELQNHPQKYDLRANFIWLFIPTIMTRLFANIRKWGAFVLKTGRWAFISLKIPTVTGLRFCRRSDD